MKFKAYGERTVLKPIKNEETKTSSGIILAITTQTTYNDIAEVVDSNLYEKGVKVLMNAYHKYNEINIDGNIFFIVNTFDILGRIK